MVSPWALSLETPAASSAIDDLERISLVEGRGERWTQRTVRHGADGECCSGGGQGLLTSAYLQRRHHFSSRSRHGRCRSANNSFFALQLRSRTAVFRGKVTRFWSLGLA
ncbi:hypothetical protein ANAPC5_01122 [Anaplasma phagocytophilum]|nr:hypothetical protein ANAPC5_01122 [Anaplasma phagocytophilum]